MRIKSLEEVVKWHLCVGCGACAYISNGGIRMTEDSRQGYRPVLVKHLDDSVMDECLKVCPVVGAVLDGHKWQNNNSIGTNDGVGPVLEVWEGHAVDLETRHLGASGGVLTALSAYAMQHEGMHGVLHVAADPAHPLCNHTVLSRTTAELLLAAGSRYAPACVCDGLQQIEDAPTPCVFIGQPSEVAALRRAQTLRPALDRKIGPVLSFFCAGSPSSQGTQDLLLEKGIDLSRVGHIRYRGRGWPGTFAVWLRGEIDPVLEMTYAESWAYVQAYRPWGVQLWPDGLGEHADIACGDPWYRDLKANDSGSSLVVVRTESGRRILQNATASGYLKLIRSDISRVATSQRNLLRKRDAVWGRLMAMRVLGLPTPNHVISGWARSWLQLSLRDKFGSTAGTVRRVITRGYTKL